MTTRLALAIYCVGPLDNDGNPTHERFEIGTYERIDPQDLAAVDPGCCWNCGAPSTTPQCRHCGAWAVAEWIGPRLVTGPTWFSRDEWTDKKGNVRRTRAHVRDLDGDNPKGHPDYMRVDERRRLTDPRTQVRLKCDECGLNEQRNGTLPADVLDKIASNMPEISAYGLISAMKLAGFWD